MAAVRQEPLHGAIATNHASSFLAASYHAQSRFNLPEALRLARAAVDRSSKTGFARARVAELEFSFGHTGSALDALNKSLALAPRNAQALALTLPPAL